MKKLNKNELEAVARKIKRDSDDKRVAKVNEAIEKFTPIAKKKAKVIFKEINKLSIEAKGYFFHVPYGGKDLFTLESIEESLSSRKSKEVVGVNYTYLREYDIVDALILAQMDANSLEELTEIVSAEFNK